MDDNDNSKRCDIIDVDRLLYYYSESNLKTNDPQQLYDIINYWLDKLILYCIKHHTIYININNCIEEYIINDIYPSSLQSVLEIMLHKKNYIVSKSDLIIDNIDNDSNNIIYELFIDFLTSKSLNKNLEYIPIKLLNEIYDCISDYINHHQQESYIMYINQTLSISIEYTVLGFIEKVTKYLKTTSNSKLIPLLDHFTLDYSIIFINYLIKHKLAIKSLKDTNLIKILKPIQNNKYSDNIWTYIFQSNKSENEVITEVEESTIRINVTIHHIESLIVQSDSRIADCLQKAIAAKKNNNMNQALLYLNMKRNNDKMKSNLIQSLHSLYTTQSTIEQCNINVIIVNAYKHATIGLKTVRKDANITADSVIEAIDDFEEEMGEMNAINESITSNSSMSIISAEEQIQLEEELNTILANDLILSNKHLSPAIPAIYIDSTTTNTLEGQMISKANGSTISHSIDNNNINNNNNNSSNSNELLCEQMKSMQLDNIPSHSIHINNTIVSNKTTTTTSSTSANKSTTTTSTLVHL